MKKYEAIGIVETLYFTVALELLDEMLKTSNVKFINKESDLGGKLVTLFVGGRISEVTSSIEAVKRLGQKKHYKHLKNAIVITNPHNEILKYIVPSKKVGKIEGQKTIKERREN